MQHTQNNSVNNMLMTDKIFTPALPVCDDDMQVMIYGNLKIRDIQTGEILVNKRVG